MSAGCTTSTHLRFLALVNDHRQRHGRAPLRVDAKLQAAAVFTAEEMAGHDHFSHQHLSPDGTTARQRVLREGYPDDSLTGENILYGDATPEEAFETWRDSPPHNENMLSPHYAAIGIGGPADPEWSHEGDVFLAWATSFGSVLTEEAAACGGFEQPHPEGPRRRRPRPPKEKRLPTAAPPKEERQMAREEREREREQREREREREQRERERERERDERRGVDARGGTNGGPGGGPGGPGGNGAGPATSLGAPTGAIPRGSIGGGGSWDLVNRFDAVFVAEGRKHNVPPAMLKSMMIVETGGKNVSDGHGATGVMQIKPAFWADRARSAGYDLGTDEGQIGMAAAIIGGSVPGVRGATPEERFLLTYYPVLNADGSVCFDCRGESGHTPRMYLDDIALYTRLIEEAAPAGDGSLGVDGGEPIEAGTPAAGAAEAPANIVWVGTENKHDRRGQAPVAIVYHVTDDMNFANVSNWFRTPGSNASAHFVIDRDGTPYQFVSTREASWTNGDHDQWRTDIPWLLEAIGRSQAGECNLNDYTVNLEFVGKPDQPFTEEQVGTAIALTRYLMATYPGIRPMRGHLLRHADINGRNRPYCPGPNFPLERIIEAVGGDPGRLT